MVVVKWMLVGLVWVAEWELKGFDHGSDRFMVGLCYFDLKMVENNNVYGFRKKNRWIVVMAKFFSVF